MKLYATVTSERARKGQGGNKYIETILSVGSADNSKPIARLYLSADEDENNYVLKVYDGANGDNLSLIRHIPKGNKQKGE